MYQLLHSRQVDDVTLSFTTCTNETIYFRMEIFLKFFIFLKALSDGMDFRVKQKFSISNDRTCWVT